MESPLPLAVTLTVLVLVVVVVLQLGASNGTPDCANQAMAHLLPAKVTSSTAPNSTHQSTVTLLLRIGVGRSVLLRIIRIRRIRALVVRALLGILTLARRSAPRPLPLVLLCWRISRLLGGVWILLLVGRDLAVLKSTLAGSAVGGSLVVRGLRRCLAVSALLVLRLGRGVLALLLMGIGLAVLRRWWGIAGAGAGAIAWLGGG